MKLAVALPLVDDYVHKQFFSSFLLMDKPDYSLLLPRFPSKFGIAQIRNDLVKQAFEENCTHIVMMDTDQVYPEDTIEKLLADDKDIVGGVVHRRYTPFEPILYRGELTKYHHVPDEECYSGKVIEVDAVGTGCLMIKTEVFKNLQKPWFKIYTHPDTNKAVGEDIHFCSEAKKAGYKIYANTSVEIDHLAHMVINRSTYELYKKFTGLKWRNPEEEYKNKD